LKVLSDTTAQTKVLANKAQFTVPSYLYGGKVLYDYEFFSTFVWIQNTHT